MNPNIAREVKFTLDDNNGTDYRVTATVWKDGGITIDAEYTDSVSGWVITMEELICSDIMPSIQDILNAIDAEQERQYDRWLERQTY